MNSSKLFSFLLSLSVVFGLGVASFIPRAFAESADPAQAATAKPASNPDSIENDETLNLTPDQKDKIKSLREDAKKQKQDVEKDKTLTPDQQTKQIKQITKQTRAQVFAILTPEQQKIWSAEQHERHQQKKKSSQ
jgi:Spy/CpxP family protein refolding chaperone